MCSMPLNTKGASMNGAALAKVDMWAGETMP
jgi:hypothetical protein